MGQEIKASESMGQNDLPESNQTRLDEKSSSEDAIIQNKEGMSIFNLNDYFGLPDRYYD